MLTPHIPQISKLKLNLTITFQNQKGQSRVSVISVIIRFIRVLRVLLRSASLQTEILRPRIHN